MAEERGTNLVVPILIGLGAWFWWKRAKAAAPDAAPPIQPEEEKADEEQPDTPPPKKAPGPDQEPCELDGSCAVYQADEAGEADHVGDIGSLLESREGASLADRMTKNTQALDGLRKTFGGAPVMRTFDPSRQSDLSWQTNMLFWTVYPLGPIKLESANSGYARAWKRLRSLLRDRLDAQGLPYTV
jgi:hypothetical protein